MKLPSKCLGCGGPLVKGFLTDSMYYLWAPLCWHSGAPEESSFLGMPAGTKVDSMKMHTIQAYRCSNCGLLHCYAEDKTVGVPKGTAKWNKVEAWLNKSRGR
jgi:hypothetical protein